MFFSIPRRVRQYRRRLTQSRLVMLVWQRHEHDGWARAIDAALGTRRSHRSRARNLLARRSRSHPGALEGAGFDGMRFEDVHERSSTETTSTPRSRSYCGFGHERGPREPERRGGGSYRRAPARDARRALQRQRGVVLESRSCSSSQATPLRHRQQAPRAFFFFLKKKKKKKKKGGGGGGGGENRLLLP